MTLDELRRVQRATPFRPFAIVYANGERWHVPHPEFLAIPPAGERGRTFVIFRRSGIEAIADAWMVSRLEFSPTTEDGEPPAAADGQGQ